MGQVLLPEPLTIDERILCAYCSRWGLHVVPLGWGGALPRPHGMRVGKIIEEGGQGEGNRCRIFKPSTKYSPEQYEFEEF